MRSPLDTSLILFSWLVFIVYVAYALGSVAATKIECLQRVTKIFLYLPVVAKQAKFRSPVARWRLARAICTGRETS